MMLYFYQNANMLISFALIAIVVMRLFPGYPHAAGRDRLDGYIANEESLKAYFYFGWVFIVENFWKIALCYFLFSAIAVFQNPSTKFDTVAFQLDQVSGRAFAQLFLIVLAVFYIKKSWLKNFFVGLGIFESLMIIGNPEGGVLFAPSLDSAFVAAILPLAPFPITILYLIAIVVAKGTTAFTIVFSQLAAYALTKHTKMKRIIFSICVLAIALIATQGKAVINSNRRIDSWKKFFEWWGNQDVALFGTGLGTFEWLGPFLDNSKNGVFSSIREGTFIHMHNDWLQVLFETGFVGLLFALIIYIVTAFKARHEPKLFAVWMGFGAFALTYHPLRFMITGLFVAYIWREIYATHGRNGTR